LRYLVDTNVISEIRKGDRCDKNVQSWFAKTQDEDIFLSVVTVGEIRRGIEGIRRRDPDAARVLERWFGQVVSLHQERILPIDREIAEAWGRMSVPDPIPVLDGLIAATARVRGLTMATRNTTDVARTGVPFVNPFARPR
jgi:predicted nucleic acid-binding protein